MRTKDFHGIPSVRHEALHWTKMLELHQGGPPATNTLTHTAHQLMRWSSVYLSLVYRDPRVLRRNASQRADWTTNTGCS